MIGISFPLMMQAKEGVELDGARGLSADAYEPYWIRGGDLCAAGNKRPKGAITSAGQRVLSERPAVWMCDCSSSAADECSDSKLAQEVLGLALCPTIGHSASCKDLKVRPGDKETTRTSYESASETAKAGVGGDTDATYAMSTNGVAVGTASAGGFVGTASYVTRSGKISYNKNEFLTRGPDGVETVTEVCVVPGDDATSTTFTSCGTKREVLPGGYKFSLFGRTWGDDYSTVGVDNSKRLTIDADDNSSDDNSSMTTTTAPDSMAGNSYLSFRTSLCGTGMPDFKVNGVTNGAGILGTDTQVTSVSFMQIDNSSLTLSFEQDYVFGSVDDCSCANKPKAHKFGPKRHCSCTPAGKKAVKISASTLSTCQGSGQKGIYLDYSFDRSDLNAAGKWFVYDPEISTSQGGKNTATLSALVSGAKRKLAGSLLLLTMLYGM